MRNDFPVLTCAEAHRVEASLFGGDEQREAEAVQRAGTAIGEAIASDFRELGELPVDLRVLVLVGKGHNGADALVAAVVLKRLRPAGMIHVVLAEAGNSLRPAVQKGLDALQSMGGCTLHEGWGPEIERMLGGVDFDVCIDGLLGMGFQPPLRSPHDAILRWCKADLRASLRAAVDLPSGLGDAAGEDIFRADITYAPGIAKAPCFDETHRRSVGRVRFLDLGFFDDVESDLSLSEKRLLDRGYFRRLQRLRPVEVHKRDLGHLLVIAGSVGMPGAALMAAQAAIRSGTGLVTVMTPGSVGSQLVSALPEAMWQPFSVRPDGLFESDFMRVVSLCAERASAILIGPGLYLERHNMHLICRVVRDIHRSIVLDASALTPDILAAARARPRTADPVIITPHPGEFRRLVGLRVDQPLPQPGAAFKSYCAEHHVCGLLKGPVTALTDGQCLEFSTGGGPVLARGGTGDILAGMVGGLLSRDPTDPMEALRIGSTWHAAAADALAQDRGQEGVRTTDLMDYFHVVLRSNQGRPR